MAILSSRFSAAIRDDLSSSEVSQFGDLYIEKQQLLSQVNNVKPSWHIELENDVVANEKGQEDLTFLGFEIVADKTHIRLKEEEEKHPAASTTDAKVTCSPVTWLLNACIEHCASSDSVFTADQLATSIIEVVQVEKGEALQSRLFDLIGEMGFSLLMEVMARQEELKAITPLMIKNAIRDSQGSPSLDNSTAAAPAAAASGPNIVGAATIQTESGKIALRQQRKQNRKTFKATKAAQNESDESQSWLEQAHSDPNYLRNIRAESLRKNAEQETSASSSLVKEFGMLQGGFVSDSGLKTALPKGTVRTQHKSYEKVYIPATKNDPSTEQERIPISQLDSIGQKAFVGITHLNRLQTSLFQDAYHSSENLLVCAPTGAGKTNVAMLTIAREVSQRFSRWAAASPSAESVFADFKIIYVAPMKALAQEVVAKFSARLAPLRMKVAELTGDMQLSRREIESTQVIVTTPEKWDVVTRKSSGGLVQQVKLLIIDEVHLLADGRGAVIETIVARTLRLVESSQSMIRIVGLSATLPNYKDVGTFLRVNPKRGLHYFDQSYRPVPLDQTFIGITEKGRAKQTMAMNEVVCELALESVRRGQQVLVFVHSRKDTAGTVRALREIAAKDGTVNEFFEGQNEKKEYSSFAEKVRKSRNHDVREFFDVGFAIHHAGMLRSDRTLCEEMFASGVVNVMVCTATLAWGVNLPAHTVLIKGTQVFSSEKGGYISLSFLDVMQIFGRAGRPQYDTSGDAIMVTTHAELAPYLKLLNQQMPIESNFIKDLPNQLNAEIVSGTVTNIREAKLWLSYTYLNVRMLRNPMVYGITYEEKQLDPTLNEKKQSLLEEAAKTLSGNRMIRFDTRSGNFAVTNLGRVASHYYIHHESIRTFNEQLKNDELTDEMILHLLCSSTEFEQIKVRDDELKELEKLQRSSCPLDVKATVDTSVGKANMLLQAYISSARVTGFTLICDTNYIAQNAVRVSRALFEIVLKKAWPCVADRLLVISKSIDRRVWWFQSPLRQIPSLKGDILHRVEQRRLSLEELVEYSASEIGDLLKIEKAGEKVKKAVNLLPLLWTKSTCQPITRSLIKLNIVLGASFPVWNDKFHGSVEPYWIWVEDGDGTCIYHAEPFMLHKKDFHNEFEISITLPIFEPIPSHYVLKVISDRWVGVRTVECISFKGLTLPEKRDPHTDLLNLRPLPKSALCNPNYEALYKFSHFNPVQSQLFHVLYHESKNVLLGAPTSSGKTVCSELAILHLWNSQPDSKVVYVAPLKALSRERLADWKVKFGRNLGKSVIEFTGDVNPDRKALEEADILITTPEKWDGVSRGWKRRSYVQKVRLVIVDEVHLLGEDRGPVLEIMLSRMRYISTQLGSTCRFVALTTSLANADDIGSWLGVPDDGLFNFRPSVRPIPMEIHLQGFPGRHYCPRMATMNKPAYGAILQYSPKKPVLIFVSSRRQTRLTAIDLISCCASSSSNNPKQFLHMAEEEITYLVDQLQDSNLKHTLLFGIGIHHAGLPAKDRDIVEQLFCHGKIQVLVCTSTLAWGVNFPAHLVIIKGTEYYDAKKGSYVDFPCTDVLQMMGRAGRVQFDTKGVACIFVHESRKNFYKQFLYEPFPVESSLHRALHNHINSEVVEGRIRDKGDAVDYITWTFYFRRLAKNPAYYGLSEEEDKTTHLMTLVNQVFTDLKSSGCIRGRSSRGGDSSTTAVEPSRIGAVASEYYLDYRTPQVLQQGLRSVSGLSSMLELLCKAHEFDELPVRHNEKELNEKLASELPWKVTTGEDVGSPNTKAFLLLQAWMNRTKLPISDYVTDTKSVLDQFPRVANALLDLAAESSSYEACKCIVQLYPMIVQGCLVSKFYQFPNATSKLVKSLSEIGIVSISDFRKKRFKESHKKSIVHFKELSEWVNSLPDVTLSARLDGDSSNYCKVDIKASNRRIQQKVHTRMAGNLRSQGFWILVSENRQKLLAIKRVPFRKSFSCAIKLGSVPTLKDTSNIVVELFSDSVCGIEAVTELSD